MSRSMDTKLEMVDGAVKITAGMNATHLEAPFDTSTSAPVADRFNPDISAFVENVGIVFGIVIPLSSGVRSHRKISTYLFLHLGHIFVKAPTGALRVTI